MQIPYYYAPSNKDFTFKPTIFDKDIFMFQNGITTNKNSYLIADFNIVDGYKSKNQMKNIYHLFSKYEMDLDFENFIESSLNISFKR